MNACTFVCPYCGIVFTADEFSVTSNALDLQNAIRVHVQGRGCVMFPDTSTGRKKKDDTENRPPE
jgi:hypothetical protein